VYSPSKSSSEVGGKWGREIGKWVPGIGTHLSPTPSHIHSYIHLHTHTHTQPHLRIIPTIFPIFLPISLTFLVLPFANANLFSLFPHFHTFSCASTKRHKAKKEEQKKKENIKGKKLRKSICNNNCICMCISTKQQKFQSAITVCH